MYWLPAVFALIVMAAGWYYVFYSPAAGRLTGVESDNANRLRIRLRRANGIAMMLLAVCFYAVGYSITRPVSFVLAMLVILVLLMVVLALALVDVRLTARFRRERDALAARAKDES
jgi:drug/metabolite transporter (DMT)-like permease